MSVGLTPAEGCAVWYGPQIDYHVDGMHVLSADEIAEIDAALAHLRSLGTLDFPQITPETFPLPNLGRFFDKLGRELLHGRGFLLLRGLPRERYSLDDIGLVYHGLGVHLGRPVAQSYQGELLGNVIDVSDVEAQARGYHAGGGQRMHSDNCDVVSLMCVRAARSGGISRIVSAAVCQPLAAKPWNMLLPAACSSRWKGCGSNSAANLLICALSTRNRPEPKVCPATKSSRYRSLIFDQLLHT